MDGDVELVGDLVVLETFGETYEHIFLAVGERIGVGLVVIVMDGVRHLVEGGPYALEIVVKLDNAGELALVLRFEVGGDKPDDAQVRQLVELGPESGAFGIIEQ